MKQLRLLRSIVNLTLSFAFLAACAQPAAPAPTLLPPTATSTAAPPTPTSVPPTPTPPSPTPLAKSPASPQELVWETNGDPNTFVRPTELTVDFEGNVYVIDGDNHRVQKFDRSGNLLLVWGSRGNDAGQFFFRNPPAHYGNLTTDKAGNLYVTDHNNRIQKFTADGEFILKFGGTGYGEGEFMDLYGIAVDETGNIYTTDWTKQDVQKFDPAGNFILKWSVPGCRPGSISMPSGIAVGPDGNLYVTDFTGNCIQQFDAQGQLLKQWGERGEADGQLYRPMGIAFDQQGNIYVAENGNGRVQKFDPAGKFLAWYGPFTYPAGLGVDDEGNYYVIEVNSARLMKYHPQNQN